MRYLVQREEPYNSRYNTLPTPVVDIDQSGAVEAVRAGWPSGWIGPRPQAGGLDSWRRIDARWLTSETYEMYISGVNSEMTITEARDSLAEVVNEVAYAHRSITLTRRGKPLAVIMSAEDYMRMIEELEDAEDARLVDAARAEGGPTIPIEEIKRELGL